MFQFYFKYHAKFNMVLKELIKPNCLFVTETYRHIDDILYLDSNINYYCENNDCINNCNSNLYGDYNDWEDYIDEIYN